ARRGAEHRARRARPRAGKGERAGPELGVSTEPFFAGTIKGVRGWDLSRDLELHGRGAGEDGTWGAGGEPTKAACVLEEQPAPETDCGCGLYAVHPEAVGSGWLRSFLEDGVTGVVDAWGRVEVHGGGFRAEFARPRLLFEPAAHLLSAEGR